MDALRQNLEKNSCNVRMRQRSLFVQEKMQAAPVIGGNDGCDGGVPLLCGKPDSADAEVAGDDGVVAPGEASGAEVLLEKLTWGNHEEFLDRHGSSGGGIAVCGDGDREEGSGGGFDFVLAADVICELVAVFCFDCIDLFCHCLCSPWFGVYVVWSESSTAHQFVTGRQKLTFTRCETKRRHTQAIAHPACAFCLLCGTVL